MKRRALLLAALAAVAGWQGCKKRPGRGGSDAKYAVLKTSKGVVKARLFADQVPDTTAHFIALATGTKKWRDPKTGQMTSRPLYNGVLFHRVIPGFMVQTGDPKGDGSGDIGITIPDEIKPGLRYDRPGLLGMANFGPNTNGSQFFITLAPTPQLDGYHTLFGEVVEGLGVVKAIAAVPRDTAHEIDRPLEPLVLESVTIVDD